MITFLYALGMYIVECYIDKNGNNIISSGGGGFEVNTNTHKYGNNDSWQAQSTFVDNKTLSDTDID